MQPPVYTESRRTYLIVTVAVAQPEGFFWSRSCAAPSGETFTYQRKQRGNPGTLRSCCLGIKVRGHHIFPPLAGEHEGARTPGSYQTNLSHTVVQEFIGNPLTTFFLGCKLTQNVNHLLLGLSDFQQTWNQDYFSGKTTYFIYDCEKNHEQISRMEIKLQQMAGGRAAFEGENQLSRFILFYLFIFFD